MLYGFSSIPLDINYGFGVDDFTIIINLPLSQLDVDGKFNLIAGTSTFDCDVNVRNIYDDIPDNGFLTIDNNVSTHFINQKMNVEILPNPVFADQFFIQKKEHQDFQKIEVINLLGRLLMSLSTVELNNGIDCSGWEKGIYFVLFYDQYGMQSVPLIKQ